MTQIAIPAGVNPASAIPADATVHQRSGEPAGPSVPVVPPSSAQEPGFVKPAGPAAGSQSGDQAEFAAFLEWKKATAAAPTPTPAAPVTPTPTPAKHTPGFEGIGAAEAVTATRQAAQADAYVMSIFSTFEMVAPDVDLARAVGNALDRGDPSLIDKAYLTEKAGDKAAKLISVAEGLVKHVTDTVSKLTTDIYKAAGGETQWNAAVEVFNTKAPKYLKEFVAQGVDSANPSRISTAVESLLDFVKQSGAMPVDPQGHVRAGGGAPNAALALSKTEYQAERMKLDRRARDFPEKERELTARRELGRKMGK